MNGISVPSIVVIGLGNTLMQDDGVGVRVIEQLMARGTSPAHGYLVDGGTLGLELLGYLEDYAREYCLSTPCAWASFQAHWYAWKVTRYQRHSR